jgi:hypothetical protein
MCPPIAIPKKKHSQTTPPIKAARPHFRKIKCPLPGMNHAAIPTSHALPGAGSIRSAGNLSVLTKSLLHTDEDD